MTASDGVSWSAKGGRSWLGLPLNPPLNKIIVLDLYFNFYE